MILLNHDDANVTDALTQWRSRTAVVTDLSSAELRSIARDVRFRSVFSARTTHAGYVQRIGEIVDDILAGKINLATGRWELMKELKLAGYNPETGFPGDLGKIPPAERGSLQDLSSERRLNLVLETNVRMAANYGRKLAGNTAYARFQYPAWELVRLYARQVERGTAESHSAGWSERWLAAGDAVNFEGALRWPMMARKDSPIWHSLGEGAGDYTDVLDNDFPPFAFNSGLGWRAVPRAEGIERGLVRQDETPAKSSSSLAPNTPQENAVLDKMAADLRVSLDRSFEEFRQRRAAVKYSNLGSGRAL